MSWLTHPVLGPLASVLWQSSLLFLVVALLAWLARRSSARVRHALWLIVLIRLAVPPVEWWPSAMRPAELPASLAWIRGPWERPEIPSEAPRSDLVATGVRGPALSDETTSRGQVSLPRTRTPGASWTVADAVLAVWLIGVAALASLLAVQLVRLRRMIRAARPAGRELKGHVLRLARRIGLHRRVVVCVTEAAGSPATLGLIRPLMILPASLEADLDHDELESVLVHELLHVRRFDLEVHAFATLIRVLYFFHPIAWWTFRNISRERELAVDECVIRDGGIETMQYRKTLVRVASLMSKPHPFGSPTLALSEGARDLKRRLIHLATSSPSRLAWLALLPTVALLALMIVAPESDARQGAADAAQDELSAKEFQSWIRRECQAAGIELPRTEQPGRDVAAGRVGGVILVPRGSEASAKVVRVASSGSGFEVLPLFEEIEEEPIEEIEEIEEKEPIEEVFEIEEIEEEPIEELFEIEEIEEEPIEELELVDDFGQRIVSITVSAGQAFYAVNGGDPGTLMDLPSSWKGAERLQVRAEEGVLHQHVVALLSRAHRSGIEHVTFLSIEPKNPTWSKQLKPLAPLTTQNLVSSREIVILADGDLPWPSIVHLLTLASAQLKNPRLTIAALGENGQASKFSCYLPVDVGVSPFKKK